jgi:four helix bundle protein
MSWNNVSDLEIYKLCMQIGEQTYKIVTEWDNFNRNTIGYQLIRSVDSIPANISEGFGRYHYKDQRRFCYFARGSLFETKTWLMKAKERIPENNAVIESVLNQISNLLFKLNAFIKYLSNQIKSSN